ncbi:MAG: hypothetical protein GKR88_09950 [Flavobacteriaceae bacterium]|nr:MAG: hypothetical protein GKR88_09950 [Flavobacteriaceae bacterium]
MKNLFLSVVLLLTVSFTFATNDVEKDSTFDVAIVEMTNYAELASVDFTMNSDISYSISSEAEAAICGFTFSWDTDEFGSGSTWVDCSDDTFGSFSDFMDVIMAWFF